jgi:alpha-glucosidase (family GH31 glycosyl hydrolase)
LYHFNDDKKASEIVNQFMWGSNIMVCPVLQKNAKTIPIYFPKNAWYDVRKNEMIQAETTMQYDVANFVFPLFYTEGSFIPTYKIAATTTQIDRNILDVLYVPSTQASSYTMYDDDGESKNAISTNSYELITFNSKGKTDKSLTMSIFGNNGTYTGKPKNRKINITIPCINSSPNKIVVSKKPLSKMEYTFDVQSKKLLLYVTLTNSKIDVDITW